MFASFISCSKSFPNVVFFLMIRRQPRFTRTDTLLPYTTLFRSFNNMLAVVVGGLELAKRKLRLKPQEANRHLDNAMEGANRAAALTRRLLAFARSEPLLPSAVDPDALVAGLSDLIDRSIGDQITMRSEEHTSELQSLMRLSYAVFCLKTKRNITDH